MTKMGPNHGSPSFGPCLILFYNIKFIGIMYYVCKKDYMELGTMSALGRPGVFSRCLLSLYQSGYPSLRMVPSPVNSV